jgi:hypothetical protein
MEDNFYVQYGGTFPTNRTDHRKALSTPKGGFE